ncbi:MAG: PHB depolymerase family esterase [Chitinophagales bacterium]
MKKVSASFKLLLSCMFLLTTCFDLKAQLQNFQHDGMTRRYIYHAPANLPTNAPLVVVMHGYSGGANSIKNYSEMNDVADEYGFAVCYPQGTADNFGEKFFNVGYDFHDDVMVNDVDFIVTLVEYLQTTYSLSAENVFATGLSNGGDMCYMLACEAANTFKAIAPVAGMMLETITAECEVENPMPVFEIHGTNDDITYFEGDINNNDGWGAYPDIPTTIDFWVNANACTDIEIDTLPNISTNDGSYVISEKHLNGINGNEVWLYKIVNGEHDWPGAWGNMDISASVEAWLFFERFLGFPTAIDEPHFEDKSVVLYPNPVNDMAYLQVGKNKIGKEYFIYDIYGKQLKKATISATKIEVSFDWLEKGLYFVNVGGKAGNTMKFLKK